ncbi:allantoinase AllB [Amycolatopsis jiangsuensis]|uniref:allantoinase n=1 Tax=Amycolatopsis jiangsuensis TaxID=1181879 RepID=A0A840ITX3_9PSEU|nr:allantoinase AllB [Amycolatopsis jiangsuensis]MBB4685320.1 allantoinase [Amycolatopsis jiangsuensis]
MDLVVRAARAVTPGGEGPVTIGIEGGRIAVVEPGITELPGTRVVDLAGDEVLLPGLVDTHVHVNDPGRAEWEGFETATRAAAAGGVTTIVDMPLNSLPPTVDVPALAVKRKAATGRVHVDVGFWGGAIPGNEGELRGLHDEGVFGFKCFLLHSGVDEFPPLDPAGLESAMRELASFDAQLIVHAEDSDAIDDAPDPHGERYSDFLSSRPRGAENLAITHVIEGARRTGVRAHVLHLSSSDALPLIAGARRESVALSVETCPHYLSFVAEEIRDGATQFKCCPPIREAGNRELLWQGLADGLIETIVSDHSPCTPELKRLDTGDFGLAWGGISSLQLGLPAIWTQARARGFTLADVVRWMAANPAAQVGMRNKGRLAPGCDADFCVFAPDEAFVVDVAKLAHRNRVSAYDQRPLAGVVRGTWLRGKPVTGDEPHGQLLTRGNC